MDFKEDETSNGNKEVKSETDDTSLREVKGDDEKPKEENGAEEPPLTKIKVSEAAKEAKEDGLVNGTNGHHEVSLLIHVCPTYIAKMYFLLHP